MLALVGDVLTDDIYLRMTHRKRRISTLPAKLMTSRHLICQPSGGVGLDVSHQIGESMLRANPDQRVNMIVISANNRCRRIFVTKRSTKISMQLWGNLFAQNWSSTSRCKHNMNVQLKKRIRNRKPHCLRIETESQQYIEQEICIAPEPAAEQRRNVAWGVSLTSNATTTTQPRSGDANSIRAIPPAFLRHRYAANHRIERMFLGLPPQATIRHRYAANSGTNPWIKTTPSLAAEQRRNVAWGVSPRLNVTTLRQPRSGDANLIRVISSSVLRCRYAANHRIERMFLGLEPQATVRRRYAIISVCATTRTRHGA